MNVLTSITQLAAMTANRAMMFMTRMVLSTMKPGPARGCLKNGMSSVELFEEVERIECRRRSEEHASISTVLSHPRWMRGPTYRRVKVESTEMRLK